MVAEAREGRRRSTAVKVVAGEEARSTIVAALGSAPHQV